MVARNLQIFAQLTVRQISANSVQPWFWLLSYKKWTFKLTRCYSSISMDPKIHKFIIKYLKILTMLLNRMYFREGGIFSFHLTAPFLVSWLFNGTKSINLYLIS